MRTIFSHGILILSRHVYFVTAVAFLVLGQTSICSLWANTKSGPATSLRELIEFALDFNSKNSSDNNFLPPENVVFLVTKHYYQIQTQVEQLATAKEIRDHFQKAVEKSEEIFEQGEGDVSQADITKLKLGLSDTLNNIVDLERDIQIAKLNLGKLTNQELGPDSDIAKIDPIPVDFPYSSFDNYLKAKNLFSPPKKLIGKVGISSSETYTKNSIRLDEENRLILHKAYIAVESSKAKVMLGKQNRKVTRALLITEVANYDFGIGDSQELFEALIIYTRVFSGYLDSIYALNVAVAELEKLTNAIY